jgi:CRISPR-associated protein (TIGR02584 family)
MTETKKNLLISVTGMSPQVITETLYGIIQANMPWPDEIEILTTKQGKEQAKLGLITPSDWERSMLEKLCQDYNMPVPVLKESNIIAISDSTGIEVDDARTYEDQEALADFIIQHVALRCADETTRIHASIAGGRKTMTFYLGYAMSLFARPGDRLTHVLVDEKFENNPQFYYPTPVTSSIQGRNGEYLDPNTATVMLADIPFVRQRSQLHKNVLASLQNESYRDLVFYQNSLNEIDEIDLTIDYRHTQIEVMGKVIPFDDSVMELAFLGMFAQHVKQYRSSVIYKPVKTSSPSDFLYLSELFIQQMEKLAGPEVEKFDLFTLSQESGYLSVSIGKFKKLFKDRAIALTEVDLVKGRAISQSLTFAQEAELEKVTNEEKSRLKETFNLENELKGRAEITVIAPTYEELQFGMTEAFFSERLNALKNKLHQHFPTDFVHCLIPAQVYKKSNFSEKRSYSTKGQQKTPYGLWLNEDNITIIN